MAELAWRVLEELFKICKHCSKNVGEDFLLDSEPVNNLPDS